MNSGFPLQKPYFEWINFEVKKKERKNEYKENFSFSEKSFSCNINKFCDDRYNYYTNDVHNHTVTI